jgi:hypothetical protein
MRFLGCFEEFIFWGPARMAGLGAKATAKEEADPCGMTARKARAKATQNHNRNCKDSAG